ncbi:hypothetical protein ACHAPU_010438 [Fusarium lateritium]
MKYLRLILLGLLSTSSANPTPQDLEKRKLTCTDPKVKAFSSSAHKIASKEINSFCSSYLKYKQKTKTVTITNTYDDWEYTTVTTGTGTLVLVQTASATGTYVISQTVGVYPNLKKREILEKRNPAYAPPAPTKYIKADRNDKVLGFQSGIVSEACSCLVKTPTKTTATEFTNYRRITSWETVSEYATTTTTKTTTTSTHYSYTTELRTKTYANPTNCGTTAQPTFFIQLREEDSSRTDGYNNWYLSNTQTGGGGEPNVTKDKKHAALVYLEAKTGYLRTVDGGQYLNSDYFLDLTLMRFNTKKSIDDNQFYYNKCKIVQSGKEKELTCFAEGSTWDMRFYQTCPEYIQWYDTPIVIGAKLYTDGPVCYLKRFMVVDAC